MLDLELFTLCLRQVSVVGDFFNETPDFSTKAGLQLFTGRLGVFDRVMKYGGLKRGKVGDASHATQDLSDFDGVIDVRGRLAILTPLAAVFVGGKVHRR